MSGDGNGMLEIKIDVLEFSFAESKLDFSTAFFAGGLLGGIFFVFSVHPLTPSKKCTAGARHAPTRKMAEGFLPLLLEEKEDPTF